MTHSGSRNPNWKGGMVTLICQQCNNTYTVIPCRIATSKTCSRLCHNRSMKTLHKKPPKIKVARKLKERFCKICLKAGVKKGRSLHPECKPVSKHKKIDRICIDCGDVKTIVIKLGSKPLRCMACDLLNRNGPNNSHWMGGITPINRRIRNSKEYAAWREAVFKRDNYTCVWCGQIGWELNADHILPFATHPALRFEITNGRTLCLSCHKKTDTYLHKAKIHTFMARTLDDLEAMKAVILGNMGEMG